MDVLNSNGEAERREKEVGFMVCRPVVFVSLCICQGVDDKIPEWIQVSVVVVVVCPWAAIKKYLFRKRDFHFTPPTHNYILD